MYQVIKRDGRRVDFDLARIANAITKAFDAAKIPYNTAIIDLLALQVTADYAGKVRNNETCRWRSALRWASPISSS